MVSFMNFLESPDVPLCPSKPLINDVNNPDLSSSLFSSFRSKHLYINSSKTFQASLNFFSFPIPNLLCNFQTSSGNICLQRRASSASVKAFSHGTKGKSIHKLSGS
ncbi:hypothetical protein HanIR_Chr03g0130851 [Helianthus annuus]|nr:hypothetical protein HanIR_Chr03g0130851 [Helianthus annuus]